MNSIYMLMYVYFVRSLILDKIRTFSIGSNAGVLKIKILQNASTKLGQYRSLKSQSRKSTTFHRWWHPALVPCFGWCPCNLLPRGISFLHILGSFSSFILSKCFLDYFLTLLINFVVYLPHCDFIGLSSSILVFF